MRIAEQRLDAAITRSTQSVGERKRRGSADEGQPHPMYQQTIHGNNHYCNYIYYLDRCYFCIMHTDAV